MPGERRALQSERDSWRSVEDAQTLTPHESVLLKVLQSVQRHMYQPHLLDDPDQLDGIPEIDGEDEKVLRPEVEAPARIISTRSRSRGAGFVKSDAGHTSEQREEEDKPSRATRGSSTPAVRVVGISSGASIFNTSPALAKSVRGWCSHWEGVSAGIPPCL